MARRPSGAVAPGEPNRRPGHRSPDAAAELQSSLTPAVAEHVRNARPRALPTDWLPKALIAGDAVIVAGSILAAYWIYVRERGQALPLEGYLLAIPVSILIFLFAGATTHQYSSWRGRTLVDLLIALVSSVGLAGLLMLAAISLFNLGVEFSRLTFVYAILLITVLMTGERFLLREYETSLRRRGIGVESVLVVGTGAGSELLIRRMTMFPQYGYHVRGVVTDDLQPGNEFAGLQVIGGTQSLPRLVEELHIDQVFLALAGKDRDLLIHLVKLCENEQLEFKIVPDLIDVMSSRVDVNAIDGLPLVGIRRSQLQGWKAALKRASDLVLSGIGLLLASPVLLVVAVLIKTTMPGPVFFRQERIGLHGRPFMIYKFRSMVVDAEKVSGPTVAKPGDHRVTRLGHLLRRFSIDEVPQLINILKGDMSLVGPRPQPTFFDSRYRGEVPRYLERQQVRPGLTGWAEVNDLRGAAPIVDRTIYDVYYIENWSLLLDLKIMLLTGVRAFTQRHAY